MRRVLDGFYADGEGVIAGIISDYELSDNDVCSYLGAMLDTQSQTLQKDDAEKIDDAFREFVRSEKNGSVCGRRVCLFVDRRCSDYEQPQHRFSDSVTFFAPPKGADAVRESEGGIIGETFFDLSQKCLIPSVAGFDGDRQGRWSSMRDRVRRSCVTSLSPCGGKVVTFSFHVVSAEVVRCYLYRNGQCIRFLPRDIKAVLPKHFAQSPENMCFLEDAERVAEMSARLSFTDTHFDAWYH